MLVYLLNDYFLEFLKGKNRMQNNLLPTMILQ